MGLIPHIHDAIAAPFMGPETTLLMTSLNWQGWWNSVKRDESSYCSYARFHADSREKGLLFTDFEFLLYRFSRSITRKKGKYMNNTGRMFIPGPVGRHPAAGYSNEIDEKCSIEKRGRAFSERPEQSSLRPFSWRAAGSPGSTVMNCVCL